MPGPAKKFDVGAALDEAVEVFRERGFTGAGTAELQRRMGVGRKSMYDTFGSKRELAERAMTRYGRAAVDDLRRRLSRRGRTPLQNLRSALMHWARLDAAEGSAGCMLGNCAADFSRSSPQDAATADVLAAGLGAIADAFAEAVASAQASGEIDPGLDPSDVGKTLLCMTQGMALVGRVSRDRRWPRAATEAALDALQRSA
ncbi:MAG: TetR/AcrR family transcriptional regulator [Planctomycetota bacterium]